MDVQHQDHRGGTRELELDIEADFDEHVVRQFNLVVGSPFLFFVTLSLLRPCRIIFVTPSGTLGRRDPFAFSVRSYSMASLDSARDDVNRTPKLRRYPQFAIGRDPDVAQLNFAQRQGH